uniref:Uncharacterized protein n=1 Tax=Globisporangium ultimum (strain ATCC 200006 / CBS 805.95 / DAOM BR144) TaxID=431595 RepID=K3WZU6_GLOUD
GVYGITNFNDKPQWWNSSDDIFNNYNYDEFVRKYGLKEDDEGSLSVADFLNLSVRTRPQNSSFLSAVHELLVKMLRKPSLAGVSISDPDAHIEFTRVNITEKIVFDAMMIEIPIYRRISASDGNAFGAEDALSYGVEYNDEGSIRFFSETFCTSIACAFVAYDRDFQSAAIFLSPKVEALALRINDGE